ncbi:protein phosphatase 1 regulatory subunit 12A isoform X7 [Onthophagus taurus]|uniref:protein phosphatase 1 regulatory subunit 12A isoform X7 n=1 Tax=Onthophagus taurus TaxID=166361 RepID=UPI0039BE8579
MSVETRTTSALHKRVEQLKRWEESDTNREPVTPKQRSRKIKFSSGCVFLAACAAGEKDEVLRLLEKGADIDTANVDGLTALHQACIDDNLDMVEFLVEHGADVNRGDNEGWTPLHATASCGFLSIAKYLIDHGANVAAVNCDGELALDITESERMEELLKSEVEARGIDCEKARSEEERLMLRDATEWLSSKTSSVDIGNAKTGATPLHVASAKGYVKVIKVLLQCGADVNKQDNDGWTPLHAASHWGQMEATELLANNMADMDAQNFVGQTPFDVCDNDMLPHLDMLKKRQVKDEAMRGLGKKRPEQDRTTEVEMPTKVKRVEVKIESNEEDENLKKESEVEIKNKVNTMNNDVPPVHIVAVKEASEQVKGPPSLPPKQPPPDNVNIDDSAPTWRRQTHRPNSFREKDGENEVTIRRIHSFQNDPDKSNKIENEDATSSTPEITGTTTTTNTTTTTTTTPSTKTVSSSPLPNVVPIRSGLKLAIASATPPTSSVQTTTPPTPTTPSNGNNRLTMIKNFFKSFVPPVRDEESETQRKAHAKRVRETRRSTQGVTLEEIKSAEQLVKMKNQTTNNNNNNNNVESGANGDSNTTVSVTATITTATPTVITRDTEEPVVTTHERRPSWRLRVDNGSKFKLEDVNKPEEPPSTPSYIRRSGLQSNPLPRPSSAPVETADTTVTLPLRRPKSTEEKIALEQDKENDARNAQATLATQAAIQRRRRPKRRSTGVVTLENMEDGESEKDQSTGGGGDFDDSTKVNHQESGNERSGRSSRVSSSSDLILRGENGEIDYKRLYEQSLTEIDRLKDKLRKSDEELRDTKQTLEKLQTVTSKNSLSELEKREKRAMERKLSEMEEELKQLQKLKAENERLRAENRALTRVVNKLSIATEK